MEIPSKIPKGWQWRGKVSPATKAYFAPISTPSRSSELVSSTATVSL